MFLTVTMLLQQLFSPFYSRFLVRTDDIQHVKSDKIRLLLNLFTFENHQGILRELIVSYLSTFLPY